MDKDDFVTVAREYLQELESKAKDSDYFRGGIDGMKYVVDSVVEAIKELKERV